MIRITSAIRRQVWLILAVTLLGAATSVLYLKYAPHRYESVARILLNAPEAGGMPELLFGEGSSSRVVSEDALANYLDVLRSRKNVEAALVKSGLSAHESILSEISETQDATDYVIKNLETGRGGKGDARASRTIEVRFQHHDPEAGRHILESVIAEFLTVLTQQYQESLNGVSRRIESVKHRLEEDLQQIQSDFLEQRRSGPMLLTGKAGGAACLEEYQQLEQSFRAAEMEKATIEMRLEATAAVLAEFADAKEPLPIEALGVIDTDSLRRLGVFSDLKANSSRTPWQQIDLPVRTEVARTQYGHLLRLLAEKQRLTADFGDGHPDVKKLDEEILLVREFLQDRHGEESSEMDDPPLTWRQLLEGYAAFLESEEKLLKERLSSLRDRITRTEREVRSLMDFQIRDDMFRSRIDRENQVLEDVKEKLRKLSLANGADMKLHELLESPRVGVKVWPSSAVCCAAGVVLGLMSGMFLGLVNDQLYSGFHNSAELENRVGLPVIAHIPRLPYWHAAGVLPRRKPQSESFRLIRTRLLHEVRSGHLKSLTASSPRDNDGKSTVLLNLAASFADVGISVVYVEANLREPETRRRLKLKGRTGLSEILEGKCTIDDALYLEHRDGFSILHAGALPQRPSELLESPAFEAVLAELRQRFDLVIVDTGPVLPVCDALVVASKVDGTLFVVRPGIDSRNEVLAAIDALHSASVSIPGIIINTFGSSSEFQPGRYRNDLS